MKYLVSILILILAVASSDKKVYFVWTCLWLAVRIPLLIFRLFCSPSRRKRTVLITGGSSVQALHLARNFHAAGARVVVAEIEGLFALARFSEATDAYYFLPVPTPDQPDNYVRALCNIVGEEGVRLFIPTCSSSPAYYDTLAKPELEILNCKSFCPDLKDVQFLDDLLKVLRKCDDLGMSTPLYYPITANRQLRNIYDCGLLVSGRHSITNVGLPGCQNRLYRKLPRSHNRLKMNHSIDFLHPWVVVQELPGTHLFTCTTVDDSKLVANVSCYINHNTGEYQVTQNTQVEHWLQEFFSQVPGISGHISFHFILSDASGTLVPVGCRVGVPSLYVWYRRAHARLIMKTCKHTEKLKSIGSVIRTETTDVLFSWDDPMPYLINYFLKFLFGSQKTIQLGS